MKWYKQTYVNHRDWILENLEVLGLSNQEAIIVLLIDFLNCNQIKITMDILSKKAAISQEDLDKILSVLAAKKYLEIRATNKQVSFILDGLFDIEVAKTQNALNSSLFDLFETEFARPLSNAEMMKLSDWVKMYDSKLIIYALRESSMYQKVSMNYIQKILQAWNDKGITAKMIEEGTKIDIE
ncbi:DnaD domain-containing protein [Anaerorhabdus furcosa]|uniref:DNA replication protein n=1 Tax=Anaerorhabdus furcosa TaxID=118967 RepID=A0A1T4NIJ2_9FIRM|nr:DnaD domain protein [Anaerorhabdus furcosa]SJZ79044.1 DNA replication protein [Anaerorhabdus furcosa]